MPERLPALEQLLVRKEALAPSRGEAPAQEGAELAANAQVLDPILKNRRVLITLACGLALLIVLTAAFGYYVYRLGFFGATGGYGADIAKFGYSRLL